MDDISAVWTALTPPSAPARVYRRATHVSHIGHRSFYFGPPTSRQEVAMMATMLLVRYVLEARVRIDLTGANLTTAPEQLADEISLLCGSVQCATAWSAGVAAVTVQSTQVEPSDTDDMEIVITLAVQCEETDR
jgi:hypothetical protein